MNEVINGFEAIKNMNSVEGFDPAKFVRQISEQDSDGTTTSKSYLDVVYRKLWFRLKHPEGAIRKFVREINDQFAIVEAKVYLDRNDPPESYIANAIVKRYFSPTDKFGDKYLETAETAAVGRALADAGFGIQFADVGDVPDPSVVDSPIGMPGGNMPLGMTVNTITGEVMPTSQPMSGQSASCHGVANNANSAPMQRQSQIHQVTFTQDMSVEAIIAQMTLEYAINLVVDCGCYRGKTLGQVAKEKASALDWYVKSYKGNNNILRAAAQFLIERAAA